MMNTTVTEAVCIVKIRSVWYNDVGKENSFWRIKHEYHKAIVVE
ncbi:MAG: hypothetical protein ACLVLG_02505 [Anaerovoracaceae bacterium]